MYPGRKLGDRSSVNITGFLADKVNEARGVDMVQAKQEKLERLEHKITEVCVCTKPFCEPRDVGLISCYSQYSFRTKLPKAMTCQICSPIKSLRNFKFLKKQKQLNLKMDCQIMQIVTLSFSSKAPTSGVQLYRHWRPPKSQKIEHEQTWHQESF